MRVDIARASWRACCWCLLLVNLAFGPVSVRAANSVDLHLRGSDEAIARTAGWPLFGFDRRPAVDSSRYPSTPHPAVARIIAPEKGATAYGSGTLGSKYKGQVGPTPSQYYRNFD